MIMMGDDNYFILIEPDLSDDAITSGTVRYKFKHKRIVNAIIEKSDPKRLKLTILVNSEPIDTLELPLFFKIDSRA